MMPFHGWGPLGWAGRHHPAPWPGRKSLQSFTWGSDPPGDFQYSLKYLSEEDGISHCFWYWFVGFFGTGFLWGFSVGGVVFTFCIFFLHFRGFLFLRAAIRHHHKLRGLKTIEIRIYSLTVLEAQVQNRGVCRVGAY